MSKFLSQDGYINIEEFTALAREIDKYAAKEQMKSTEIYFVPKVLPKYDKAKAKTGGQLFERKRAQLIKIKKRMPAAGARMKMVVVLHLYKGIDETEFDRDVASAIKAIEIHNKAAEKTITLIKKEAVKKRETVTKEFDKNLTVIEKILIEGGIKKKDLAIGQSMMGKSMTVRLPNGGYISIGKADKEKFDKALEPPKERTFGRPKSKKNVDKKKPKPIRNKKELENKVSEKKIKTSSIKKKKK